MEPTFRYSADILDLVLDLDLCHQRVVTDAEIKKDFFLYLILEKVSKLKSFFKWHLFIILHILIDSTVKNSKLVQEFKSLPLWPMCNDIFLNKKHNIPKKKRLKIGFLFVLNEKIRHRITQKIPIRFLLLV